MIRSSGGRTVEAMEEQFRILGRERQADLAREAERFALADQLRSAQPERPSLVRRAASLVRGRTRRRLLREAMRPSSGSAVDS
jgi:hypothetical protein